MLVEILMPELGESVHEGTVSRWLKKEGDVIKEDEPVVEIMTDKVNTELQAPASGVLVKIVIPEGGQVEVFKVMGLIDSEAAQGTVLEGGVASPAAEASAVKTPETEGPEVEITDEGERTWFTPVVRSIAKEHGISTAQLKAIPGTGAGGRVTKRDLEAYIAAGKPASSLGAAAPVEAPRPVAPTPATRLEVPAPAPSTAGPDQQLVPLAGLRKMIAEAMVRSAAVPVVSTLTDVDVSAMVKFRAANKDAFQEQYGVKLTFTPFFIKAITEALLEYPLVNSALMPDNQIAMNGKVHMGIAVALGKKGDEGLIVPVIRDCQSKSLIDLAKDLEAIAAKARSNQLSVSDVQGGTFTLTNPGSYGAVLGTPMINAPQAAILGTYTIKKQPVIVDDMIAVRSIMNLVLTYDHRLIDGLLAGRFLQSVKQRLESFAFFK